MIRLATTFALAMLVSLVCWLVLDKTYANRSFASKEVQESLTVTEEHSAELQLSRLKSDVIAFGMFAALLSGACGIVCVPKAGAANVVGSGLIGLLLGFAAGAAGAWLGHMHDARVVFIGEPMIYWFIRWLVILLPIGIAAGLAAYWKSQARLLDAIVAGAIGASLAAVLFCLTMGSLTPIELHVEIYPAHSSNRLLVLALAAVCISGMLTFQLGRQAKAPTSAAPGEADLA